MIGQLYQSEEDFLKALRASGEEIPRLIIFLGMEHHIYEPLIKEYEESIRLNSSSFDMISLNGLEVTPEEFHGELFTSSLFSANKLVVLKHGESLLDKVKNHKESAMMKNYSHDLKAMSHSSTFFFLQMDTTSIPSDFAFLKKIGVQIKLKVLYGRSILNYFKEKAKNLNTQIGPQALEELMEKTAWDFKNALRIFDQLVLYSRNEKELTRQMIASFCEQLEGNLYFEILDNTAQKNIPRTIRKITQHKFDNALQLLDAFNKLFSDSYRFIKYKKLELDRQSIRERLGLSEATSYVTKKSEERFQIMLRNYPEASFPAIFQKLIQLDERLKTESKEKHQSLLIMFVGSLQNV